MDEEQLQTQLEAPLLQRTGSSDPQGLSKGTTTCMNQKHKIVVGDRTSRSTSNDDCSYVSLRDATNQMDVDSNTRDTSLLIPPYSTAATSADTEDVTHLHSNSSSSSSSSFLVHFMKSKGPPQLIIICLVLALGFGCTVGVVPAVMTDRYARLYHNYTDPQDCSLYSSKHNNNNNNTNEKKPQECLDGSNDAQNAVTMANFVSNGFTFCTSSLMGSLSDEYGRKTIFMMGIGASTLAPCALVLIQLYPSMNPTWYYTANAISGVISWTSIALSALSDVMPSPWRAASFGLLLAGSFLGFAISPMLALWLSHFWVSVLSLSLVTLGFVATLCGLLPETLPPEVAAATATERRRQQQQQQHEHQRQRRRLVQFCTILTRPMKELSILNRNHLFRLLSALAFCSGMVMSGNQTLSLYYFEERLGVNDHDVAIMFAMVGLLGILVQGLFIKPMNDWLGEQYVIVLAFFVGFIHNVMYGLAKTKKTIYIAIALASITGMAFPTISAIKSNNVDESEQGRIQGALYSLQALASAVGPILLRFVYSQTKDKPYPGPGCMFLFASLLYLVAVVCACALPREQANSSSLSLPSSLPPSTSTSSSPSSTSSNINKTQDNFSETSLSSRTNDSSSLPIQDVEEEKVECCNEITL